MLHSSTLIGNSANAPDLRSRIIAPRRGDRVTLSHHPRIASCRARAGPSRQPVHADPFMPIQTNRPRHALRQYRGHRRFQRSRRLLNFSTPRAAAPGAIQTPHSLAGFNTQASVIETPRVTRCSRRGPASHIRAVTWPSSRPGLQPHVQRRAILQPRVTAGHARSCSRAVVRVSHHAVTQSPATRAVTRRDALAHFTQLRSSRSLRNYAVHALTRSLAAPQRVHAYRHARRDELTARSDARRP